MPDIDAKPTILVADDDPVVRSHLVLLLERWHHKVIACEDGAQALKHLDGANPPDVAILDWVMPGIEGPAVCRRAASSAPRTYLILLTVKDRPADIAEGLRAGAHDFLSKPFHPEELRARLQAGVRVHELQTTLTDRVAQLEAALSEVKQLHGLLPICCYCKRIRDDEDFWDRVENYLTRHTDVQLTHGICPHCLPDALDPPRDRRAGDQAARDPAKTGSVLARPIDGASTAPSQHGR